MAERVQHATDARSLILSERVEVVARAAGSLPMRSSANRPHAVAQAAAATIADVEARRDRREAESSSEEIKKRIKSFLQAVDAHMGIGHCALK